MRYIVSLPVEGGFQFFGIYDREKNENPVTIHKAEPGAERRIREICDDLNRAT